jgi:hypothetical protein
VAALVEANKKEIKEKEKKISEIGMTMLQFKTMATKIEKSQKTVIY